MSTNENLLKSKINKNDEFFTNYKDIESECVHYQKYFEGKVIFCNCDDYLNSNFVKYFRDNFTKFKLKGLHSINKGTDGNNHHFYMSDAMSVRITLIDDGDFSSDYSLKILGLSDIVISNPPFSKIYKYIKILNESNKKYIFIGNKNSCTNVQYFFNMFMNDLIWLGVNHTKGTINFQDENGINKSIPAYWYTNLEHNINPNIKPLLTKTYNPIEYPKYDNYDIINVDKIKDIPIDYNGIMGVPITFVRYYRNSNYKILGMCNDKYHRGDIECRSIIDGVNKYARLLIQKMENNNG